MASGPDIHILRRLVFPSRYEALAARVGDEVARILVPPEDGTLHAFELASLNIRSRGEGLFLPLQGRSGTGKTTVASNLAAFLPNEYAPSVNHSGEVSTESLLRSAVLAFEDLDANDNRVLPINVDDRESNPPTDTELAAIKRFLRHPEGGSRAAVLWPETTLRLADEIAERFREVAGQSPIDLPLRIQGPPREAWRDIAVNTMRLANGNLPALELIGVDPRDYVPDKFPTIGDFLRRISDDFSEFLHSLLTATRVPLTLVIAIVSETADAGVLSQLTSHSEFGLVDSQAIVDATRDSAVGRWWAAHRGLLTQTIVRLNARVFCLPPSASIPVLRRFAPAGVQAVINEAGIRQRGLPAVLGALERTDIGRFLTGTTRATFEARGTPARAATGAFQVLAQSGFTAGRDKALNGAFRDAFAAFVTANSLPYAEILSETALDFVPLIPDTALMGNDQSICLEYAWRSGDFLTARHRAESAQYILTKLRNYARELGWEGS